MEVGMPRGSSHRATGAQQLMQCKLWLFKHAKRKRREVLRLLLTNELVSDLSNGNSEGPVPTRAWGSTTAGRQNGDVFMQKSSSANCAVRTGCACRQFIHLVSLLANFSAAFSTPLSTSISLPPHDNRLCDLLTGSG